MQEDPACAVCSRTLLKGEQLHEYVSPSGERLVVCIHCRSRAEASGWIPAEQYGTVAPESPTRARRGQELRRRLGRAASRVRAVRRSSASAERSSRDAPSAGEQPQADSQAATESGSSGPSAPIPPSEVEAEPPPAAERPGQGRPRRPREDAKRSPTPEPPNQHVAPQAPQPRRGPEAIMRLAVERFNSSEEARKVAGLIRSLGEPQAAVRPDQSRQMALVTVAWELSWYQWEVGADGDDGAVREVAKGKEVSELAEDARAWNAAVAEDGTLRLHGAARRPEPSAKSA